MLISKKCFRMTCVIMSLFMILGILTNVNVKVTFADTKSQNLLDNGDFENVNDSSWSARGSAEVSYTTDEFHAGKRSLKITGRTKTWEGPIKDMTSILKKGGTYHFAVWVKYNDGPSTKAFNLQFENIILGTASYASAGSVNAEKGKWTLLEGDYTVPNNSNLTKYSMYIEVPYKADDQVTKDDTMDFYIDDAAVTQTASIDYQRNILQLKKVFKNYFPIGAAINPDLIDSSNIHAKFINYQYNTIVAGNAMKPDALEPTEGNFYWKDADKIVDYAQKNNMILRGHTLLWHNQVPSWFFTDPKDSSKPATRQQLLGRLKTYISTVARRYKGKVYAWDVVNEVLSDTSGLRGDSENSKWKGIIGDVDGDGYDSDYIELAFKYAHEADPNAKLIINDYGLESSTRKMNEMYTLVKRLLKKGVPIDGIGIQMHISMYSPEVKQVKECIEKLSSLKKYRSGFTVQVTEMDMSIYSGSSEKQKDATNDILLQQAYQYRDIFNVFKEEAKKENLSMVVMWGNSDDDTWLDNTPVKGRKDAPLLFDRKLQAKPAFWGIVDPSKLPVQRHEAYATEGTPVLSDTPDNLWGVAKSVDADNFVKGKSGATAKIKTMWDSKNLYIMANVKDTTPNKKDGIEIYIDKNYDKAASYQSDDKYYDIYSHKKGSSKITYKAELVKGGYTLQAVIPISDVKPAVGNKLGIDFKVKDYNKKGKLSSEAVWNDTTNKQRKVPANFGDLILQNESKLTYAIKGTPVVDGSIDKIWGNAAAAETNKLVQGTSGSTAKVRTMWDEKYLYVLADVTDNNLSKKSNNSWEQDSVEIFIDQLNDKATAYDSNDGQYRINFDNEKSFGGNCDTADFKSATSKTATGYIVEAAIPLNVLTPKAGDMLGVDFQVNNDEDGDGTRDSIATWCDSTGMSWSSTSNFGNVLLKNN
ncbi:endo-1,4-beta-xylanase [Clostridium oryzae]|uniref:Beta-xylanase n=1 Tax=Clostridium oryzae TaxID=1450648 RepID=A0A1V4I4N0_9CLOT|nr:endo-1,4-beta-xylanase [Clostridium oryzae]OPJ54941.1 endo-1,4-beta-xylanase C precursor [Clostridium oryzae]